jgi:HlyD family secretion protein
MQVHKEGIGIMNKKTLISISGLLVILVIFFLGYIADDGVKGSSASTGSTISGTVEAKEMDVASKIPGKIVKLAIEEGKDVKKGDILLEVDKKDLEIKRLQAQAAVKGAKAQLDKAVGGARSQQIAQAKAAVDQAEAQVKLLENKYNRLYPLYEAEALPLDQLEEVETKLEVARLQAQQAHEQLGLVLEGAQAEDIQALESRRCDRNSAL